VYVVTLVYTSWCCVVCGVSIYIYFVQFSPIISSSADRLLFSVSRKNRVSDTAGRFARPDVPLAVSVISNSLIFTSSEGLLSNFTEVSSDSFLFSFSFSFSFSADGAETEVVSEVVADSLGVEGLSITLGEDSL
jgi:hypothetical protein